MNLARKIKMGVTSRILYQQKVSRKDYIILCEQMLLKAGENGCDIVLLPENFDTFGCLEMAETEKVDLYAYNCDFSALRRSLAEPIPGPLSRRLGVIASRYGIYVVANYTELVQNKMFNTAVVIDRTGQVVGKYRKTHLCAPEKRCFGIDAGNELPVFKLDFGTVGIAICMDIYFPELFRVLTLKGAEIILWPHQTYGPSEETLEIMVRSKAIDYNCVIMTSNFASPDYYAPYSPGHAMTGRAMIINHEGLIIAETGHYPGLAITEIDLDLPKMGKDVVAARKGGVDFLREDMLCCRRPDLYSEITTPHGNTAILEGRFFD
jgi:predicted amidohydrolase